MNHNQGCTFIKGVCSGATGLILPITNYTSHLTMMIYDVATGKTILLEECKTCKDKCCNHFNFISVNDNEIKRIAMRIRTDHRKFKQKYCHPDKKYGFILNAPCPFFKNDKCSIYDARPQDCKSYDCRKEQEVKKNVVYKS